MTENELRIVLRVYEFVKAAPRPLSDVREKFGSQPDRAVDAVEVLDKLGKIRVDQHKFSDSIAHSEFSKSAEQVAKEVENR